jgi:hypothetical protein
VEQTRLSWRLAFAELKGFAASLDRQRSARPFALVSCAGLSRLATRSYRIEPGSGVCPANLLLPAKTRHKRPRGFLMNSDHRHRVQRAYSERAAGPAGRRQKPLDRLRSVAVDGITAVGQATLTEDAGIELRGSLAAFASNPEVPHRAGLHHYLLIVHRAASQRCYFPVFR